MTTKEQLCEALLIFLVSSKLDSESLLKWEENLSGSSAATLPSWCQFHTFLTQRCQALEHLHDQTTLLKPSKKHTRNISSLVVTEPSSSKHCVKCNHNDHTLYSCSQFLELSAQDRLNEAKRLRLCINCLKPDHVVQSCKSQNCRTCKQRHHTLLHLPPRVSSSSIVNNPSRTSTPIKSSILNNAPSNSQAHSTPISSALPRFTTTTSTPMSSNLLRPQPEQASTSRGDWSLVASPNLLINQPAISQVILGTAVVLVADSKGRYIKCRALLDTGSTPNFITEVLAKKLHLPEVHDPLHVNGIGASSSLKTKRGMFITFKSHFGAFNANAYVSVVPRITGEMPSKPIDLSRFKFPKDVVLADPCFHEPGSIDLLLGADQFVDLICDGKIDIGTGLPKLLNTTLGWIIMGKIFESSASVEEQFCHVAVEDTTESLLRRLWEVEDIHPKPINFTPDEQMSEDLFIETTHRDKEGRYVVKLPFLKSPTLLGGSFGHAVNRFYALERRLRRLPEVKVQYTEFMAELLNLGHIAPVSRPTIPSLHYFMPHHAVLKPTSSTTKLRVVFNASAPTDTGTSLNQLLAPGPKTQDGLIANLLRFRLYKYAFCADITKMYRQVVLDDNDTYFQLILWRNKELDELQTFRITRVIYGTTPASFLATRVLKQLAHDYATKYPLGSKHLVQDLYVDDMLSESDDLCLAKLIKKETTELLRLGGFELRKWCSNCPELLEDVSPQDQEPLTRINDEDVIRTLGLNWYPDTDMFRFSYQSPQTNQSPTKRTVVSDIARLFDPLGLVGPVISLGRIFVQELWSLNLNWDTPLSTDLVTRWLRFRKDLHLLKELCFPRRVLTPDQERSMVQLHGFSDASNRAYGACCYIVTKSKALDTKVELLCSRSKVAPIHTVSLPRLELCGALLLSEMIANVVSCLHIEFDSIHLWTDSSIVLHWLRAPPNIWQTFVANRVSKIQSLTKDYTWNHVPTADNPADLISRGCLPRDLVKSDLWFHGPLFLQFDTDKWPSLVLEKIYDTKVLERRTQKFSLLVTVPEDSVKDHKFVNSFTRLRRVYAYVFRFITKVKDKRTNRVDGQFKDSHSFDLTAAELIRGEEIIILTIQKVNFPDDYHQLSTGKPISSSSHLRSLYPFMDLHGLIRVGGRLQNAPLNFDLKHQIILPKDHPFTRSLIRHFHLVNYHVGAQTLNAIIRRRYWIVKGKTTINSEIAKCIHCFSRNPKLQQQLMGHLPVHRIHANSTEAFVVTGVDCAGPFIATHGTRGRHTYKIYLVVFICLYTKAVHLDVITNLTTKGFLNVFKRFIATRGKPKVMYSDNGLNFVGASRVIAEDQRKLIEEFNSQIYPEIVENGIEWHFNPPRSPHTGGLWESAVKSSKRLISNAIGKNTFTLEEFYTVVKEVEAIINSRPLCPVSNDPNDVDILTPGHFIIGKPLVSLPEFIAPQARLSYTDRFKQLQHIRQKIWNRYSTECLHYLQQRHKWISCQPNIVVGSLVLLKEENSPPLHWPRGRITAIHPGPDGLVRVVTVKVGNSLLKRSIHSVALLPMDSLEPVASTRAACSQNII